MRRGRPFPTHTPLGRFMQEDGLSATMVSAQTGIHHRVLSDYLAARKPMSLKHLALLSRLLDCDPELLYYEVVDENGDDGDEGNDKAATGPTVNVHSFVDLAGDSVRS